MGFDQSIDVALEVLFLCYKAMKIYPPRTDFLVLVHQLGQDFSCVQVARDPFNATIKSTDFLRTDIFQEHYVNARHNILPIY